MLLLAVESDSIIHVNSEECLYCSDRTESSPKLNTLNRVRLSKKKIIFHF